MPPNTFYLVVLIFFSVAPHSISHLTVLQLFKQLSRLITSHTKYSQVPLLVTLLSDLQLFTFTSKLLFVLPDNEQVLHIRSLLPAVSSKTLPINPHPQIFITIQNLICCRARTPLLNLQVRLCIHLCFHHVDVGPSL